jgi:delta24-sterol reductase
MIPFASHPLYRFFWGWMGAPEVSLLKLFQGPVIRKDSVYGHVVQESCMPVRRLTEGVKNFEEWWDIYPLLLFPLRVYDRGHHSGFLHPRGDDVLAPASLAAAASKGPKWGIWCVAPRPSPL